MQPFHCTYHPQSSELVVHARMESFKLLVLKLVEPFTLPWPEALPLVLLNLRITPSGKIHCHHFKLLLAVTCNWVKEYMSLL